MVMSIPVRSPVPYGTAQISFSVEGFFARMYAAATPVAWDSESPGMAQRSQLVRFVAEEGGCRKRMPARALVAMSPTMRTQTHECRLIEPIQRKGLWVGDGSSAIVEA